MAPKPWTLRERQVISATKWVTIERNRYLRDHVEIDDYFVLRRSSFVVVVAVDAEDRVLMVREYRAATERSYLAFPAGYINDGEEPVDAARRELVEETGATGRDWQALGVLDPLPGYIQSSAHVFRCDIDHHDLADRVPEDVIEEVLEVVALPRTEVRAAVLRGEINEMQAVAAFLLADATAGAGAGH